MPTARANLASAMLDVLKYVCASQSDLDPLATAIDTFLSSCKVKPASAGFVFPGAGRPGV
ncbi:MAG: hypothetical protein QM776_02215 [Rhodocyclaceae bacterium]